MKRTILFTVLCTVITFHAFADDRIWGYWSWSYWYSPVSYSEAKVYFQVWWGDGGGYEHEVYVAGEGPLPDSNEDNSIKFPFIDFYRRAYSWSLPWRKGGVPAELGYKMQLEPSSSKLKIVRVRVDEGITHIGNWWFAGLKNLPEPFVPLSLQSIGEGAFNGCTGMQYFSCADRVSIIGRRAFEGCTNLAEFNVYDPTGNYKISEAPLNIDSRAFADCGSLKHFKIPAGSTLGDEVFKGSAIESVDLGNHVTFGSNAFQDCKNFKQFTVPANYTLGDGIFSNSSLETVTVNDNVTFGKYAFLDCKNLKSVTFSGRLREVSERMFWGCSSLLSINIPNGVTSIGNSAFFRCISLQSVNIPNSVTSIGDSAFILSWYLPSVIIPNSVTKIGIQAFSGSGLTSITVPGSVKDIALGAFSWCGYLTSAKICEGVKFIGDAAFQDCEKLETVSLPASLDSIDGWAFGHCNNLKVIECNGTTPPAMHPEAFHESDITETSVCVPYGSVDAYRNAPVWKDFKNIGTYPAGIHIINGENFTVNSGSKVNLTARLTPHDAVPAIIWTSSNSSVASVVDGTVTAYYSGEAVITATTGNGIFKDSCKITVKFGKTGLVLGKDYFQNSQNAKHITIPANCTLEDGIFANSSLETVTVNDNVNFGKLSFQYCKYLNSITFQGRINAITEGMFEGCISLRSINIPNGVTSICDNAFYSCICLSSVTIPNSVTSIGDNAFLGFGFYAGSTSITIPNSVTKLGIQAFIKSGFTTITVPGSVKDIALGTFAFCEYLTSAKICEGVKFIGDAAFQDCGKLETVSLPASLDSIDSWAFGNCYSLKVIECNSTTPPAMHSDAFIESDLTNVTVYVPHGSVDAYRNAPVWKDFPAIVASPQAGNK